ncbi:hypothetical protein BH20ACT8_BH20ACT8_01400 [soil metagenome]
MGKRASTISTTKPPASAVPARKTSSRQGFAAPGAPRSVSDTAVGTMTASLMTCSPADIVAGPLPPRKPSKASTGSRTPPRPEWTEVTMFRAREPTRAVTASEWHAHSTPCWTAAGGRAGRLAGGVRAAAGSGSGPDHDPVKRLRNRPACPTEGVTAAVREPSRLRTFSHGTRRRGPRAACRLRRPARWPQRRGPGSAVDRPLRRRAHLCGRARRTVAGHSIGRRRLVLLRGSLLHSATPASRLAALRRRPSTARYEALLAPCEPRAVVPSVLHGTSTEEH